MLVVFVLLIVLLLFLTYGGVALPALVVTTAVIAFWVMVIRLLIGFGRWMLAGCAPQWDPPVQARRTDLRGGVRLCEDSLCQHVNPPDARYCAQCGKRVA